MPVNTERNRAIREAYSGHASINRLAKEHGISKQRVYQIIHAPEPIVTEQPKAFPPSRLVELARAWQLGRDDAESVATAKAAFIAAMDAADYGEIAAALASHGAERWRGVNPRGHPMFCQRCLCELPNHSTSCALLEAIREHCRVVYYPPNGASPIEHTMAANKNSWDAIVSALRAAEDDRAA